MKKAVITALSSAFLLTAAMPAVYAHCGACGTEKATKKGEFPDVTVAQLESMIKEGKVVVIDVNGTTSFKQGRIPGALDFDALGADGLKGKLPSDKNIPIVAYCGGPKCSAYKQAAKVAASLGYTDVHHFSGGISGWKAAGKDVEKG